MNIFHDLSLISPEIWMVCMTCFILLSDLYTTRRLPYCTYILTQITIIGAMFLTLKLLGTSNTAFNSSIIVDNIANFLKCFIYFIAFFVFMYSRSYVANRSMHGEYYTLSLFSILGMMILVSAHSLLTLYLGLELLALPLYAMIALYKMDQKSSEASMKYFVMGALASGMLLYGISLLYGATTSIDIGKVANFLMKTSATPSVIIGMVFLIVGLAFKLGAVPFHMWIPDVYQGAPTSVTMFISTLSKIAGFGLAMRILIDTLPSLHNYWQPLCMLMAILSLVIGNFGAIVQSNLKRMLGYSTIAHIGFVFLGFLVGPTQGYSAALIYLVIYTLMTLGAFGIIMALSHRGFEADNIEDFTGLGTTQPWVAFLMLLILFSFAGVPPLLGFYAKFIILQALVNADLLWLAVLAVIFSVIGAYYYLRVVRVMFFEAPVTGTFWTPQIVPTRGLTLLSLNGLAILALGIYPAPLINLCMAVFKGV